MSTGQEHIRDRELAIAAGLMTESDAGVLTYAGQARTFFVTQGTLVIVKVRVTLGGHGRSEKVYSGRKALLTVDRQLCPQESLNSHGSKQPPVGM